MGLGGWESSAIPFFDQRDTQQSLAPPNGVPKHVPFAIRQVFKTYHAKLVYKQTSCLRDIFTYS